MARICQQVHALPIIEHRSASILFAGGGATSPAMRPSRWRRATVRTQGRGPPTQAVHISIVRRMSLLRNTFEVIRRAVSGTARKLACCLRTFVTHGAVIRSDIGSNRVTGGIAPTVASGAKLRQLLRRARTRRRNSMRLDAASQAGTAEPQAPPARRS